MDFGETLLAAQRNQHQPAQENVYYRAKFEPPKKEQKPAARLSANIERFLAKKEEEERQKLLETKRKRDELLAMRDPKATKKIQKMLKVIKSANKSVLEEATDREHTAVTRTGSEQPDQDDYGYESQEAAAIYTKMMEKYSKMPEEEKFPSRGGGVKKDLNGTRERMRQALKQEEEPQPRHRQRKARHSPDKEDSPPPQPEKKPEKEKPKFRKPLPPPIDFNQLLRLAEQKKSEPVALLAPVRKAAEPEPERLMTKKQKREFEEEQARREARMRRIQETEKSKISKQEQHKSDSDKIKKNSESTPTFTRIPKLSDRIAPANKSGKPSMEVIKKPEKLEPKKMDRDNCSIIQGVPNIDAKKKIELKSQNTYRIDKSSMENKTMKPRDDDCKPNNYDDRHKAYRDGDRNNPRGDEDHYKASRDDNRYNPNRNEDRKPNRDVSLSKPREEDRFKPNREDGHYKLSRDDTRSKPNRDDYRYNPNKNDDCYKPNRDEDHYNPHRNDDRKPNRYEDRYEPNRDNDRKPNSKPSRDEERFKPNRDEERKPSRDQERFKPNRDEVRFKPSGGEGHYKFDREDDRKPNREDDRKPNREDDRKPNREDDRKSNRDDDRKPNREDGRHPIREDGRHPNKEDYRKLNRDDDRKLNREDSRQPNRDDARKANRDDDRKPNRDDDRKPHKDDEKIKIRTVDRPKASRDDSRQDNGQNSQSKIMTKPIQENSRKLDMKDKVLAKEKKLFGSSRNSPNSSVTKSETSKLTKTSEQRLKELPKLSKMAPNNTKKAPIDTNAKLQLSTNKAPSKTFDFDKHVNSLKKPAAADRRDERDCKSVLAGGMKRQDGVRQFPPADIKKKLPPGDARSRNQAPKRRMIDSESEYDSELEDFIDDGEDAADYSKHIKEIFGYDKSRYRDMDEDDAGMESTFAQQMREEFISKKIGIMEDLEDMRQEALEKKRNKKKRRISDDD